jgi:amino acid transporter
MERHAVAPLPVTTLRQGALGPLAVAFFVISAAGPLVAMAGGIPVAMLFGNGPGLPTMFVLATLLLVFSHAYTAMAREVPNAGAFYAFAARGLGPAAAGGTGGLALLSYNALQIGLYGLFGAAAKGLLEPVTGVVLPWWLYAALAMASIAVLGYRQVDLSAKVLGLLVAGEYAAVLLLDGAVLAVGGAHGLDLAPFGAAAIALMMCFTAFVGFEAPTIYSEEARDPERTIPRATYCSALLIGGFYAFSTWAMVMGSGSVHLVDQLKQLSDPTELLFTLSERYAGGGLSLAMRVLFVTSTYASLLAFHNAIARYLYAMGRERVLPAALGQVHPRHASPHRGSLAQSGIAAVAVAVFAAAGADPVLVVFTLPSALATLGILALMAIAAAATARHFRRTQPQRRSVRLSAAVSLVAFQAILGVALLNFRVLMGS